MIIFHQGSHSVVGCQSKMFTFYSLLRLTPTLVFGIGVFAVINWYESHSTYFQFKVLIIDKCSGAINKALVSCKWCVIAAVEVPWCKKRICPGKIYFAMKIIPGMSNLFNVTWRTIFNTVASVHLRHTEYESNLGVQCADEWNEKCLWGIGESSLLISKRMTVARTMSIWCTETCLSGLFRLQP